MGRTAVRGARVAPETLTHPPTRIQFTTIGVYGFSEAGFFEALQAAAVDTFCDIRWRRGMRGSQYAFANSARLQRRLAESGIRYCHVRDVAPPPRVRQRQSEADKAQGTTKRKRTALGEVFIDEYRREILSTFESRRFIAQLPADARVVALFCVEREPAACHRSLLAERLQAELDVSIDHVLPGPTPP